MVFKNYIVSMALVLRRFSPLSPAGDALIKVPAGLPGNRKIDQPCPIKGQAVSGMKAKALISWSSGKDSAWTRAVTKP